MLTPLVPLGFTISVHATGPPPPDLPSGCQRVLPMCTGQRCWGLAAQEQTLATDQWLLAYKYPNSFASERDDVKVRAGPAVAPSLGCRGHLLGNEPLADHFHPCLTSPLPSWFLRQAVSTWTPPLRMCLAVCFGGTLTKTPASPLPRE